MKQDGDPKSKNGNQADDVSLKHGNIAGYLAARIKLDVLEIAARVDEFPPRIKTKPKAFIIK